VIREFGGVVKENRRGKYGAWMYKCVCVCVHAGVARACVRARVCARVRERERETKHG